MYKFTPFNANNYPEYIRLCNLKYGKEWCYIQKNYNITSNDSDELILYKLKIIAEKCKDADINNIIDIIHFIANRKITSLIEEIIYAIINIYVRNPHLIRYILNHFNTLFTCAQIKKLLYRTLLIRKDILWCIPCYDIDIWKLAVKQDFICAKIIPECINICDTIDICMENIKNNYNMLYAIDTFVPKINGNFVFVILLYDISLDNKCNDSKIIANYYLRYFNKYILNKVRNLIRNCQLNFKKRYYKLHS